MFIWLRSEVVSIYQPFQYNSPRSLAPIEEIPSLSLALFRGRKTGETSLTKVTRILAFLAQFGKHRNWRKLQ
jgi:hypothetical protein